MQNHKIWTVAGIDQGRSEFWIVIYAFSEKSPNLINQILADSCGITEIFQLLDYHRVDLAVMDNEPDRLSARDLAESIGSLPQSHPVSQYLQEMFNDRRYVANRLLLADQKTFETDLKPNRVKHGSIELPVIDMNTSLYFDKLTALYSEREIRVIGKTHRKFQKHLTSVTRNLDSGRWQRKSDHDDDLAYASLFALVARDVVVKALALYSPYRPEQLDAGKLEEGLPEEWEQFFRGY